MRLVFISVKLWISYADLSLYLLHNLDVIIFKWIINKYKVYKQIKFLRWSFLTGFKFWGSSGNYYMTSPFHIKQIPSQGLYIKQISEYQIFKTSFLQTLVNPVISSISEAFIVTNTFIFQENRRNSNRTCATRLLKLRSRKVYLWKSFNFASSTAPVHRLVRASREPRPRELTVFIDWR